jgi:putative two-component system response regulator
MKRHPSVPEDATAHDLVPDSGTEQSNGGVGTRHPVKALRLVQSAALTDIPILIVDDQETNIRLLERMLQDAGYTNVRSTTDSRHVFALYQDFRPDLILLDLHMPYMDGYEVMELLQGEIPEGTYFPILVLTADATSEAKQRALSMGAKDFLSKPLEVTETLLRIKNLLETRSLHVQLANQNQVLDQRVKERTKDLEEARIEILKRLALAADYRDDSTGQHIRRVGRLSALLAGSLELGDDEVELIRLAAPLHDVGKITVPDEILLKPGKLTAEEFELMKEHTSTGAKILSGSKFQLLRLAEVIALAHHEWWDGTGYPRGLNGEAIPLAGRIVGLADVYDALTHDRPYKKAWSVDESVAEIHRLSGTHFDPLIVAEFTGLMGCYV